MHHDYVVKINCMFLQIIYSYDIHLIKNQWHSSVAQRHKTNIVNVNIIKFNELQFIYTSVVII